MIGVIERVKNNVLLKCSTLNDDVISNTLNQIIDTSIYHFAEEVVSITGGINLNLKEDVIRTNISKIIRMPIIKKLKRKLFIDSLALQITNDSFIERYVNREISIDQLNKTYVKELLKNKNSNQLNMTEDLNLDEIIEELRLYLSKNIIPLIEENTFLVSAINLLIDVSKTELENNLDDMINNTDLEYLNILNKELKEEVKEERKKGVEEMMESINEYNFAEEPVIKDFKIAEGMNKFDKYDDMTLFNKMVLSLNTKEEKLSRNESRAEKRKEEVDNILLVTNKNIEANIERENSLSKRKLELNSREIELNSKLSEAEVIFLNMKPLIKGLNKIKVSDVQGGSSNE